MPSPKDFQSSVILFFRVSRFFFPIVPLRFYSRFEVPLNWSVLETVTFPSSSSYRRYLNDSIKL